MTCRYVLRWALMKRSERPVHPSFTAPQDPHWIDHAVVLRSSRCAVCDAGPDFCAAHAGTMLIRFAPKEDTEWT